MSVLGWSAKRKAAALRRNERALKDAVHDFDKWSYADSPSQREDRIEEIHRLIRQVEALGGDALAVLPFDFEYLAAKAMPDVFVRVRGQVGGWETRRR